jgi:hypothetical protein
MSIIEFRRLFRLMLKAIVDAGADRKVHGTASGVRTAASIPAFAATNMATKITFRVARDKYRLIKQRNSVVHQSQPFGRALRLDDYFWQSFTDSLR